MPLSARPWRRPVVVRQHTDAHRQATWLELFFDLSFVVAVAQAAIQLEHFLTEGHPGSGLVSYLMVFAAIRWARRVTLGEIVLLKGGGASFAVVSAFAAPLLTVPGVVLVIGLMLAGLVVYGVTTQHRLYLRAAHEPARDEIRIA